MKRVHKNEITEWVGSNGKRHRINGPAIEGSNGTEKWCINGILHRLNGPAVIANISKFYVRKSRFLNDNRHNINGPAIQHTNGAKFWYINDIKYSETDYKRILKLP